MAEQLFCSFHQGPRLVAASRWFRPVENEKRGQLGGSL